MKHKVTYDSYDKDMLPIKLEAVAYIDSPSGSGWELLDLFWKTQVESLADGQTIVIENVLVHKPEEE